MIPQWKAAFAYFWGWSGVELQGAEGLQSRKLPYVCITLSLTLFLFHIPSGPGQSPRNLVDARFLLFHRSWENIKCTNIHIIGIPETEEKEQETDSLFEIIMTENFLNLSKEMDMQVQGVQRVPNKTNPKKSHTKTHQN